jgi:HAD superfamily hydrolase (TIGR01509 family)
MSISLTTTSLGPAIARLPRRPAAVVFDLDGTLFDSERLVRAAYFAAAPRFNIDITEAQFLSLVGLHRAANDERMRRYFGAAFPLENFYAAVSEQVGAGVAPLKPGALELMDALDAAAAPFALATSSGRPWVDKHFLAHNLGPRFRAIVTRQDVTNGKPHPEPYLKAAAALGFEPKDILAIEDSPTGLASANAAGMMTILAPDLIQPDDDTRSKALHVVTSLHDVVELLRV